MIAPLPPDESARLDALRSFAVLDTSPEPDFDDLTRLAATVCGTPIALVSLVDSRRQWFKSRCGLDAAETPRDIAFCAHAILGKGLFEVADAAADPRFRDNPLVAGGPRIRFYAGMPLTNPDGFNVGTLCVLDRVPRTLSDGQRDALRVLARQVVAQLLLRKPAASLRFQESEQAREQETFRVLFEQSSDAHLIFDERDGIIDCNYAAVAMLRCRDKSEVLALHPAALSPEFQPCGRRSLDKCVDMDAAARRHGFHRFDWTHRRADGEDFPCEVTLTPVALHGRSVLLVVWHDLTDRKRAEDALRASEERFRLVWEKSTEGMRLTDADGTVVLANPAYSRLIGRPAGEVVGRPFTEVYAGGQRADGLAKYSRRFAGRTTRGQAEAAVVLLDGSRRWFEVADSYLDLPGQVPLLLTVFRDVTDRRRAEDALRASEDLLHSAFDGAAIGMALVAPDGRWLRVNRSLSGFLGYSPADLLATDFQTLTHPDDLNADLDLVRRVLAGDLRTYQMEKRYFHKDGRTLHGMLSVSLVRDAAGDPLYFVSQVQDIGPQKAAEAAQRQSEERFQAFMDNNPAVAFMKDADGRYAYLNEPFIRRHGVRPADWLGRTDFDVWPADTARQFREHDTAVRAGGVPVRLVETTPNGDGTVTHWQVHKFPFVDAAGRQFLAGMALDMTAEMAAEDALRRSEAKFRGSLDRLAEGVFLVDVATGALVDPNAAMLDMLGYTRAEFLALKQIDLSVAESPEMFARVTGEVRAALAGHGRCDLGRRQFKRKDGAALQVDVRVSAVDDGGTGLYAVVVRDVTEQVAYENRLISYHAELEEANAKLKALAVTDGLTGVRNRAAFNDRLTEEFDRAARTHRPLSLLLLDVDHFKQFNDTFGHPAGDAVLKMVARTLVGTARLTDFVARYGGEEFVVVLPDTDHAGAMVLAERCRRAVAEVAWKLRSVTVSIGVATLSAGTLDAAVLVQEADTALYKAKQAGRNRVTHGGAGVRC